MNHLTQTIQILCFLLFSNFIFCQDYSWGGGNGEWNDPQMWYPNGVPQLNDEVFIAKGTVYIQNGYSAAAKFVEVHQSGELMVNPNSSLTVAGNTNGEGILNYGIVETFGEITSNAHSGSLFVGVGFRNFGKFIIYAQGGYSSTACGGYALLNEQDAICNNKGTIEIINNGSGIRNHGSFKNSKFIVIVDMDTSHGITNHGDFNNVSGGSIQVQGNTEFGILSSEMTSLGQLPGFINNGKINVRDSEWWCMIVAHGTFTNQTKGTISLVQSVHSGLSIDGVSTFNNHGTIITQNHAFDGIRGIGNLINHGFIKSSDNGDSGMHFFDIWTPEVGSIINYGEIELHDNAVHDISLEVELHNTDEGYIYTENSLEGSAIINDGIFSSWHNGSHNITFENNGVLEDVHNSLPNIQNNQIVIRPLNGPLQEFVVFNNALDKASTSNTTISFAWYDQLGNGNAGALYFSWTNSIYPNSYGAAAPTLWMDATIQSSGLKRTLRTNILGAPVPMTQSQMSTLHTITELEKHPEFKIYPNPIVNSFKIDASKWPDHPYTFKLFDVSGKEVFSKNIVEYDSLELPLVVRDGIHFGVVFDGANMIYRQKILVARGGMTRGGY